MLKPWIAAFRLRTLPLALTSIGTGSFMAARDGAFNGKIFGLAALTTVLLQILSNLANDYGDSIHGADHAGRSGPSRAVQSGAISAPAMKKAVIFFALLALVAGIALLWQAFGMDELPMLLGFLGLGLAAIWAAITYTAGSRPYGYAGLGDVSVLIFFGLVGVGGSYYLHARQWSGDLLLPALTNGLFAVAVLNLNNIRDIPSDTVAGKFSIPVRLGRQRAVYYHWCLLAGGLLCTVAYTWMNAKGWQQWLFLITVPLLVRNAHAVYHQTTAAGLDPFLRQMALTSLLFCVLFGIGLLAL